MTPVLLKDESGKWTPYHAVPHISTHIDPTSVKIADVISPRILWRNQPDIGINRREKLEDGRVILGRNPEGTIDREVIVVRLDRPGGEPLACLLNFATHPVSQTHKGRLISADFPGYAREVVEGITGSTCMYIQGASGNINSEIMEHSLDSPRTLGKRLGGAAVSPPTQ